MSSSKRKGYSRRKILVAGGSGLLSATLPFSRAVAQSGEQNNWRFCGKCSQLFFDGYPEKGRCPAGGGHSAIGFNFRIEYSSSRTQELPGRQRQYDWRFCHKCCTMFFDGYPNKGTCSAGNGHAAAGFIFGLWDVNGPSFPTSKMQNNWRFCNKCHALFFDGYPEKGRCSAGGGHVAQGYNFKLFYVDDAVTPPSDTPSSGTRPTISVSSPQSQTFLVQGSGFLPGKQVAIRIADDALNPNLFYYTTATSNGSINMTLSIPCGPGRLYFSANDGSQDSRDRTGLLWSNTVSISCQ
jgi:hypothetical protein